MGTNRSTILVDATMDLTGISDKSMKRVQKMIKENILSNNEINLEFNKSGKSAILKQLDVVYDRINNVKKLAASVNIGSSQYKMSIDDYSGKKKDVLKANKDIAAQEEKINALKEKGRKTTAAEKAELKELKATLKEMNENRELLAKGLIKDTSLKGSSRYASSNLLTSKVSKTSSTTKLTTDEKLLNEQYDKQAFLIKSIAKLEAAEATTNAKRLSDELAALKSLTAETEERIRLKQSSANAESTISTAQAKATSATSEAAGIKEIAVVKQRNTALNEYKRILRELEKEEYNLARETNKQKASVMNQTTESKESISSIEKRISKLKSEAELQKKITNTKYAGDAAGDTKQYSEALDAQSDHLTKVSNAQKKANSEFAKSKNILGIMNENFKTAAARIVDYTLVYRSLWAIMNKMKQAVQTVIELNKSFTDIQMVTGYNQTQINALENSYSSLARQMGATVDEVAAGATEWLRQGKSISDTNELLKQSMILSKTGAMESSQATTLLTSTLNGYKMTVEDASRVVDVLGKLDMITASSAEELATAFSKTANSARLAGIPFENLAGLIATVSETTRKSAATIGNSIKTLTARFQNVKIGKFIDDETGETINDVEGVLNKIGISVRNSEGDWRDMWDVMDDVAKKWNSLNDLDRNAVVQAMGGTYQKENLVAIFENWNKVLKYTEEAFNSAGFAAEKYEIYLDNIEGKTNTMIATYQDLVSDPAFVELIKKVLDVVTSLGKLLDKIGLTNIAFIAWSVTIGLLSRSLFALAGGAIVKTISSIALLVKNVGSIGVAFGVATKAMLGMEVQATALSAAAGALIPILAIAAVAAITALVIHMNDYIKVADGSVKSTRELKKELSSLKETSDDASSNIDTQSQLAQKYASQLKELSSQTNLTTYEQAQMKFAVSELNKIIPNLNLSIDATTGKLNMQYGSIVDNIKAFTALSKAQAYQSIVGDKQKALTEAELGLSASQTELKQRNAEQEGKFWVSPADMAKDAYTEQEIKTYKKLIKDLNKEIKAATKDYEAYATSIGDIFTIPEEDDDTTDVWVPEDSGGGSAEETAIEWTDTTQSIIDAANQLAIFDKKQSSILEYQISEAEAAKDYAKQIELQNKLLENQQKTITDLKAAQQTMHEQADAIRSTTSFDTESWFNADNTDSKEYITLLNLFAGKTDEVSKGIVEKIKKIHDQLKLLKDGWGENQTAIEELEKAATSVADTMSDVIKSAVDSVNSVLDEIVDLYKKQYDEEMDDLEELYDKKKDLADKEYEDDKERLDKKLENFQDYIQAQKDLLDDQADEDTFNSDLADKQQELAEIQSQINELSLAVGSGDRVAVSKSEDLMEELADKQKEIDDLISERSKTLQEDALDDSLSDYEDYIDSKQDILDEEYNEQLEDIESWYNKKKEKLEKNYSDEELYSKARRMLINGEYEELQTLYTTYMDDQSEGWLQLGDILEDSFVAKLREAAELLAELEEGGISTSRLIKAISGDSGSSSGGSTSGQSHTTLGGGFDKMTTDDWEKYKQNKKDYENGNRTTAASSENAALRKKYGIANDKYSYAQIKGYYDSGGEAIGTGYMAKNTIEPERVLSSEQTAAFNKLVSSLPSTLNIMSNITAGMKSYVSPSTSVGSGSGNSSIIQIESLVKIEGDVIEQSKVKQMEDIARSAISDLANKINSSRTTYNQKFSLV